jgi:hypothetical protein
MDYTPNTEYSWKLVTEHKGEVVAAYDCPREVVGGIIESIVTYKLGEKTTVPSHVVELLKAIVDSGEVSISVLARLANIPRDTFLSLLSGELEVMDSDKLVALTKIIEALRDR